MNAIMNKNSADVKGCTMYVALFPCNECAKLVIQSGIKQVIYVSDKYHEKASMIASRRLLDLAGVKYRWVLINSYPPKWRWLAVDIYKYLTLVTDTEGG